MKKYDKSYYAGVAVLIISILAAILLGQARKPISADVSMADGLNTSLDTSYYEKFLRDDAGVLSEEQEEAIRTYNANWDHRYNSVAAVVTVGTVNGAGMENLTYDWANDMGLGEGDAILLVAVDDGQYYLNYGDDFATIMTSAVYSDLGAELSRQGEAGENILNFYTALDGVYRANFGLGNDERRTADAGTDAVLTVSIAVFALIAIFILLQAIERKRFSDYHARYYGVAAPSVVYRPIFFWHGPGSWWYRRRWIPTPPPPPPPTHTTGSGGSTSVFGGAGAKPSRGGGTFGGRPTGAGMRGGFGGSFGGSRGGGFHSGGSFGGSRGGGFHGGRGGGFGGKR